MNLVRAREIIGAWVQHYNEERLHAGIGYLPPAEYYRAAEYYRGDPPKRRSERQGKLATAREWRRQQNQERRLEAAA